MPNKDLKNLIVSEVYNEQRVDNFVLKQFKSVPKSRVYKAIRNGEVRVNKKRVEASHKLKAGDILRLPPLKQAIQYKISTIDKDLQSLLGKNIIFENQDFLVINKPSGLAVHAGSKNHVGLVEALKIARPDLRFLELAHRLDKGTSGCLLLAKKASTLKTFHQLFKAREVHKTYWALVKGRWDLNETQIDLPLATIILPHGDKKTYINQEIGKYSSTIFKPIEVFETTSLIAATPKTGRTHQIRVHAKHLGFPIAGDEKYGDKEFNQQLAQTGLNRLFLHAHEIDFCLAPKQQHFHFKSNLDITLNNFINHLKNKN